MILVKYKGRMKKITLIYILMLFCAFSIQNTFAFDKSVNNKSATKNINDKNFNLKTSLSFKIDYNNVNLTNKYKNDLFYYRFLTEDNVNSLTLNKLGYQVADEMILSGNFNQSDYNKHIQGNSNYSEATTVHTREHNNVGLIEATYNYIFNTLFKLVTSNYVSFGIIQSEKDGVTNGFTASIYPTSFTQISYSHAEEDVQDISKFSFYYYHGKSSRFVFRNVLYKDKFASNYDTLTGIEYQILY